jgi:hypothetical protein
MKLLIDAPERPWQTSAMEQGGEGQGYEAPEIRDYGRVTDITAGHTRGDVMDHEFPANTHPRDMGFS